MYFKSKSEAYTYVIATLIELQKKHPAITPFIDKIKICFENHEQSPSVVALYLYGLLRDVKLNAKDKKIIDDLATLLVNSNYKQSIPVKFVNPLARRFESELQVLLLQEPTPQMMQAVSLISKQILLEFNHSKEWMNGFLQRLQGSSNVVAFGSYQTRPTKDCIIHLLTENEPKNFAEIMYVHFKFALLIFRDFPIFYSPAHTPAGKLNTIIKEHLWDETEDAKDFFTSKRVSQDSASGERARSFITDNLFCNSSLYRAGGNRGREGSLKHFYTSQLGLMLHFQDSFAVHFPCHRSRWVADCKGQRANLKSRYVLDLIENDAIYVAGPSGLISLFLGQMEILGNFEKVTDKQHYLAATVAYIVGGGFHSLHEALGPAEYILDLIPGYLVTPPDENGTKASPPNFNAYFSLQNAIDSDFKEKYDRSWQNYIDFFNQTYKPLNKNLEDKADTLPSLQFTSYFFSRPNQAANENSELKPAAHKP